MRFLHHSAVLGLAVGFFFGLVPSLLLFSVTTKVYTRETKHSHHPLHTMRSNLENIKFENPTTNKETADTHSNDLGFAKQRKVFLDCGANVASTVLLFRETYPGGHDFTVHSFEIDDRLVPYFSPYDKHHLHCPVGVAGKNGNMTAFSEMTWGPQKGRNHGKDMQWGGGTLFVSGKEKSDTKSGGTRKLSYRKQIPVIDLSQWIINTFSKDDYIVLKLDVEGAEFEILRKMIDDNAFAYIDKYYGEYHDAQPTGWSKAEKNRIRSDVAKAGFKMIKWAGETRSYGDIETINPVKIPEGTPGRAGGIYSKCQSGSVALTVAIGMNPKRAHRVVSAIATHKSPVPVTLFVYGDFVEAFPKTVKSWASRFSIGMREDGHNPPGHLELMPNNWVRMGLISTILRLEEIDVNASYYLPTMVRNITDSIVAQSQRRGLRIIQPAVEFPARQGSEAQLTWNNYYRYRDVERVPKALRQIHNALNKNHGGILSLDTDLPDTYMNSVFLLDYLVETSGFKLVDLNECIAKSA